MSGGSSKFDSFLKRVLVNSEYKEVKAHEPCVVLLAKKHAFRYIFLTNERIYITQNPPKSLLFHLDLKEIVAVKLVRDKALFLQPDLQEHVQHVVIKHYKTGLTANTGKLPNAGNDAIDPTSASMHQHNLNTSHSSTTDDVASTSSLNSIPMFCSYTDVQTIERVARSKVDGSKGGGNETSLFPSSTWNNSKIKAASKNGLLGSWQHSDPSLVHVTVCDRDQEIQDLHLYILNERATFHMMLKSVWRNYIVYRSYTDNLSQNSTTENSDKRISAQKQASYEQSTRALFSELKQELLATESVEHLYQLYHELKEASINDILLKHLFWRDQTLFDRTIHLVTRYTNNSVPKLMVRCDEIELLAILLRCLGIMLREVEAIPQCYRILQNLSQSRLVNIVNVLLKKPALFSHRWLSDNDLSAILLERVNASCEVIYQLIRTSDQVHWIINGVSDVFNSTVLLQQIDKNCHLEEFLNQLLNSCVAIWSKPAMHQAVDNRPFQPDEAIDVFHMLTVLHRVLSHSNSATQYARSNFQEEFRYYVNPSSVANRFPSSFPISGMARDVVHATGAIIAKK